jgi:UDP-N-acetylmuramate dehydrogenase
MRVGGRVEWLLEPATPDELRAAYRACLARGIAPRLLGGGANLVIADGVLPGVVLTTDRMRRIFRPASGATSESLDERALPPAEMAQADPADDPRLVAWAGATMPALLRAARGLGYSGLEGLVGVPGHVGGGVTMNAGGRWGDMWDCVESVRVLDEAGEFVDVARADAAPRYRDGGLGRRPVVGVVLRFEPAPRLAIAEKMREYLRHKRAVQPVTEWSAGCIFKNPDKELSGGRSAGQLVEETGGKALRRGDAVVSPLHGNFIVNEGRATATDVFTLMEDLRDHVAQKSGIELVFEVERWLP